MRRLRRIAGSWSAKLARSASYTAGQSCGAPSRCACVRRNFVRSRAMRRPKAVVPAVLRVSASVAQSTANFCVVPLRWPDGLRRVSTDGPACPDV